MYPFIKPFLCKKCIFFRNMGPLRVIAFRINPIADISAVWRPLNLYPYFPLV